MADTVTPVTCVPGTPVAGERVPIKTLSQQDFLKLLVAQMTQQVPMSDMEMIPQMGSFTELELSNFDLANKFTNLIITQRACRANAPIVTTTDEMLQEQINLKR